MPQASKLLYKDTPGREISMRTRWWAPILVLSFANLSKSRFKVLKRPIADPEWPKNFENIRGQSLARYEVFERLDRRRDRPRYGNSLSDPSKP